MLTWRLIQTRFPSASVAEPLKLANTNNSQAHSAKAMTVLAEMLDDPDPRVRIRAAEVLLDRGYGKPKQPLEHDVGGKLEELLDRL